VRLVRPTWPFRFLRRDHRRALVVDGRIGFTGGFGISDAWAGQAEDIRHWRDLAVRLEGPVVAQLQATFATGWREETGRLLVGDAYFPALQAHGRVLAQAFPTSPRSPFTARVPVLLGVAGARRSIRLAVPYFVPDRETLGALVAARARGVEVEILVPGPSDVPIVNAASRSRWGSLLAAGVRIWRYRPTVMHAKAMIVDDTWVALGSMNVDALSFRRNDEIFLHVLDPAFARAQAAVFEGDRERCQQVTLDGWRRRGLADRVAEALSELLRPWL
jgi:cardiolipin synthase